LNIENRLMKLEQMRTPEQAPLVMIKFEAAWTPEQQQQIDEAEAQGRMILKVVFVGGKQDDNA
jgi:Spy/CpxP family protein refolding chaperone